MAPDPALLAAHEVAQEMLSTTPPWIREDPDLQAVIYCAAKETALRREKIEEVRAQFFPATATILLPLWEATFGMTIAPVGLSVTDRQQRVGEAFLRAIAAGTGVEWERILAALVGPGTLYEEADSEVPSNTVPSYTIRVTVPYGPSSDTFARIERALRAVVPANTDLILTSAAGFVLDASQLDQEPFGGN